MIVKSFAMCDTEIFYDLNFFMGGVDLGTPRFVYVCFLNMTLNQGESKHAKAARIMILVVFF